MKRTPLKRKTPLKRTGFKSGKPAKPIKQKSEKQRIKARLEILSKSICKERDNFTCQYSGKKVTGANCHASHVINVARDGRLAFDPLNMKVLTFYNHMHWWHKNPMDAGAWFTAKFPERWAYLQAKRLENRSKGPIKESELLEMEAVLKDQLENKTWSNMQ